MLAQAVRLRRRLVERRVRRVPAFRTGGRSGQPTVYYVAPDRDRPSGGIRVIYRHVDALNAMGIPAAVMHGRRGFSCTWFEHDTRVVAGQDAELGSDDVLVVPEWYGPALHEIPDVPRLVVFNQKAYDTFDWIPFEGSGRGAPYAGLPRLTALLAVSVDNVAYLSYAFPGVPVGLTRNVIDPRLFHAGDGPRERRIAFVPTRRGPELTELQHLLRARGVLDRWGLAPISGRPEHEAARLMRDSAVFLSLSDREGFGLPPAEAMASGCYVVGYPGLAGREFFDPADSVPVADGDAIALAQAVEAACERWEREPEAVTALGRRASERVLGHYSEEGLRADLKQFWGGLL